MTVVIKSIYDFLLSAWSEEDFNFIVLWGYWGKGKSTLAIKLAWDLNRRINGKSKLSDFLREYIDGKVPQHVVFNEFKDIVHTYMCYTFKEKIMPELKTFLEIYTDAVEKDIRIPIVIWDDMTIYFNKQVVDYNDADVKWFFSTWDSFREYVATLMATSSDIIALPVAIFRRKNLEVRVHERGMAQVEYVKMHTRFRGSDDRPYFTKFEQNRIVFDELPEELYSYYRGLKRKHYRLWYEKYWRKRMEKQEEDGDTGE